MEKIDSLTSQDIVQQNLETLKQLFPTIVKEGKLNVEELQALLGEYIEDEDEFYRFTWAGKNLARQEANKPSTATLRPNKVDSKDWDTTGNIFIEGDNLEVLKLLQKSYSNKIKMIYIDPPYNTGKDFVYKDNYKDNLSNYLELTGQKDSAGNKTSTNTESDGRYHSNWLNMMYPRLRLARNLLTEDGVIFISIDDNEQANLKKLCDEVFGEENFVSNVIWERAFAPKNDAKYFSDSHDHILVYTRNINEFQIGKLERSEKANSRYKNFDNDSRGVWISDNLTVKSYSEKYDYPIITPSGREVKPSHGSCWRVSKDKLQELVKDNRIWFGQDGDNVPRLKRFLSEVQDGMVPISIWPYKEVGHNQEGRQEVKKLFDDKGYFDGPKPIRLLSRILTIANVKDDSLILDFFAGSGTTAHAVMQLNAEDEGIGNRKCISVQLPEPTDEKSEAFKATYTTIAEITKERLRRAGEKVKETFKEKEGIEILDIGFRAFTLDSSNIQAWDSTPDQLEGQLDVFDSNQGENIKADRSEDDILFEILIKFGLDLTVPIQEKNIDSKTVYNIGFGTLFICLADQITPKIAETIGNWKKELNAEQSRVIFKDSGFATDADKTNCVQILRQMGIEEVNSI